MSRGPAASQGEAAALLVNLFDAFNRGDEVQLARVFGPNFHWYSATEGARARAGHHFVAFHPDEAQAYFANRRWHNERLDLLAVNVAPTGDISFVAGRQADDLPLGIDGGEWPVLGKGRIDCTAKTIDVWSRGMGMGIELSGQPAAVLSSPLCPEPPLATPSDAIVACSRVARR